MIGLPVSAGHLAGPAVTRSAGLSSSIGMLGFVASQVLHIPFNQFILNPIISDGISGQGTVGQIVMAAILLGLSAGVFEEVTSLSLLLPVAQEHAPVGTRG